MNQSSIVLIIFVLIIILLIGLTLVGVNLLMKRALKNVIKMFRTGQAFSPETAKHRDELGLKQRSFIHIGARDYKPMVLQLLQRSSIVHTTEDGRIYLSEEALSASNFEKRTK
jgi:hypothetical protein